MGKPELFVFYKMTRAKRNLIAMIIKGKKWNMAYLNQNAPQEYSRKEKQPGGIKDYLRGQETRR